MSFDPKTSIFNEMNWTCLFVPLMMFMYMLWTKPSRLILMLKKLIKNIEEQFKIALKSKLDNSSNIFISAFLLIMICNMMGLMPNIFTSTSHISLNMMISMPMWTGFMIFGWMKFTNKMFAHLVPNGTPTLLINFMVIIEMISNSIRPMTLSIRLMANMVSGHLLLTLMGNMISNSTYLVCILMILVQMVLTVLEMGVALIQAYVFCMLLTLYSDESDYTK
uniref:ATP synthase subunit a n=1 Tax=Taeniothrips tigris TaxID=2824824 RepID=A0A8A9WM80_9NEOP|nr:ATP synthase F0 subunit 6 [Taeniothrips tigris]QTT60738.1 ATP synthase F0 subunit 6 [Taeniothrips tigris]